MFECSQLKASFCNTVSFLTSILPAFFISYTCLVYSTFCNLKDCSLPGSSVYALCWSLNILFSSVQFSLVQSLTRVWLFATPWTMACQASLSITNSCVYSNSCPLSRWYHLTISSSVIPFSSCLQSFPASRSFQMSQFFPSGGRSTGVSASASVLPMNIQDWFPLVWTGLISLLSKQLSRVFSTPQFESISLALSLLYGPTLTSVHD